MHKNVFTQSGKALSLICVFMVCVSFYVRAEDVKFTGSFDPLPVDLTCGNDPDKDKYFTDGTGYQDESIYVKIYQDRDFDTNILYVHIKVAHPSQVRTAPANTFKHKGNQLASTIASRYNAVIAINGDYFQFNSERFIVRQSKLVRNRPTGEDLLLIDSEGDFHAVHQAKKPEITAIRDSIEASGRSIYNAFSFGPILVENDEIVFPADTNYFNTAALKKAQRAIIAQLGPLEYLIVSTEGPEDPGSEGLQLNQAAEYTLKAVKYLGKPCLVAYNLDGGSSNSLILNNQKVNSPKNPKKRPVSDIIYFATLVP